MRRGMTALAVFAGCAITGCAIDPSGLGEDILLFEDAATADAVSDVTLADSPPIDASADSAADATTDAPLVETASDADDADDVADTAADSADALVTDTADTLAPDTADASVTDTRDAAVPCTEANGVPYLGHCYFPLTTAGTQAAQIQRCIAVGAHLASITSAGEQAIVAACGTGDRWIGLVKDAGSPIGKASFHWSTGESSQVYDNWEGTNPNDGTDCARMQPGGGWGDVGCTTPYAAVCERE